MKINDLSKKNDIDEGLIDWASKKGLLGKKRKERTAKMYGVDSSVADTNPKAAVQKNNIPGSPEYILNSFRNEFANTDIDFSSSPAPAHIKSPEELKKRQQAAVANLDPFKPSTTKQYPLKSPAEQQQASAAAYSKKYGKSYDEINTDNRAAQQADIAADKSGLNKRIKKSAGDMAVDKRVQYQPTWRNKTHAIGNKQPNKSEIDSDHGRLTSAWNNSKKSPKFASESFINDTELLNLLVEGVISHREKLLEGARPEDFANNFANKILNGKLLSSEDKSELQKLFVQFGNEARSQKMFPANGTAVKAIVDKLATVYKNARNYNFNQQPPARSAQQYASGPKSNTPPVAAPTATSAGTATPTATPKGTATPTATPKGTATPTGTATGNSNTAPSQSNGLTQFRDLANSFADSPNKENLQGMMDILRTIASHYKIKLR